MFNSPRFLCLTLAALAAGSFLGLAAIGAFADNDGRDQQVEAQPAAFAQDGGADPSLVKNMIDQPTKDAIKAGLAYLARNQHLNGSFGTNGQKGSIAVTALAGLAFMAGGSQPDRGEYGKEVTRALEYIIGQEDRGFLQHPNAQLYGPMYGHGFGTLFLAEAQGMVHEPKLRDSLRKTLKRAVELIINSQNDEGGWRYQPVKRDADISVTICQIMALRAAKNAGIAVPKDPTVDKCIKYVKECQDLGSGGFRYQRHVGRPGFARSAAGVVALYSAGLYDGEEVRKGLEYLKQYQPGPNGGGFSNPEDRMHYFYGHYYAAQAMWIAGGKHWKDWFPAIRDDLITRSGMRQQDGSWADRHHFCPHYCTAMALIILQIPNNYLPILQR